MENHHKLKMALIIAGVIGAYLFIHARTSSNTSAPDQSTSYDAATLMPITTDTTAGGVYSTGVSDFTSAGDTASAGSTGGNTMTSTDSANSVSSFAQLLQGILAQGASYQNQAQDSVTQTNAQSASTIAASTSPLVTNPPATTAATTQSTNPQYSAIAAQIASDFPNWLGGGNATQLTAVNNPTDLVNGFFTQSQSLLSSGSDTTGSALTAAQIGNLRSIDAMISQTKNA